MNLVALLLAADRPVPFKNIQGRVVGYDDPAGEEALQKRFDRDKSELRQLGIPVEYVAGTAEGDGYVIPGDRVFQKPVSFSPQEAVLLAIAGRVGAAATGGGPLEEALKSALRKLSVDVGTGPAYEDLQEVTVLRGRSGDPRTLDNLAILGRAVTHNRRVRLTYAGLGREASTTREVDPYGLGLVRGAWYLVGYCHLRRDLRVFKVARILGEVVPVAQQDGRPHFHVSPAFRLEEHLPEEGWTGGAGAPLQVRVQAGPEVDVGGLPRSRVLSRSAAGALVELEVRHRGAFVRWVLSWGGAVCVLEPEDLRRDVAAEAGRLLKRYSSGQAGASSRQAALEGEQIP